MAYLTLLVDLFAVLLFLASIEVIHDYQKHGGLPYPPGPRPKPIVGNLLDIPKDFSWLAYAQFSKTYGTSVSSSAFFRMSFLTTTPGNIMSFRVFGQVIIVLHSINIAKDLLEKNGDVYADRPAIPFYEMWVFGLLRHDFD